MTLTEQIATLTGARVTARVPLHGGDLSKVERVDLDSGQSLVAKQGPQVAAEAAMLRTMARVGAPVPKVLGEAPGLLLLEFLPETPSSPRSWAALGQALRKMHKVTGDTYGWDMDYAFGTVGIPNSPCRNWPQFWAENRLLTGVNALPPDIVARLKSLADRLPGLLPQHPPAALLHGDLWSGNVLFTGERACFIDPACYYGDAEVDLAMLTLFGQPPNAFYEGYGPLPHGHEKRRPVYQLWPALVHLRLFGAGYRGMVTGLLDSLGA
ncbi:fructosamine kinase family protein [Roseovarius sp. MMSF_3281]|uniref:fructosamine kinase family protein n=1 Tax=Roseovarius sp. MMSF_3281 TaxID=3046694 RepID=UPI00273DFC8E|nr:fructosamine kinase family protein [Roseovarius sp. MMSF_3281]